MAISVDYRNVGRELRAGGMILFVLVCGVKGFTILRLRDLEKLVHEVASSYVCSPISMKLQQSVSRAVFAFGDDWLR